MEVMRMLVHLLSNIWNRFRAEIVENIQTVRIVYRIRRAVGVSLTINVFLVRKMNRKVFRWKKELDQRKKIILTSQMME